MKKIPVFHSEKIAKTHGFFKDFLMIFFDNIFLLKPENVGFLENMDGTAEQEIKK